MRGRCGWLLAAGVSHPRAQRFLEPMAKPANYPVGYLCNDESREREGRAP